MKKGHKGAKILFLDIESSPILGYAWRTWQTDLLEVVEDWRLLMVGYKWAHEKSPKVESGRVFDEIDMCYTVFELLDKADIVVAHNGDRFDIPKLQAKLLSYGSPPPSPFKTIDTLKIAKKHFGFSSNKLDALGSTLQLGNKTDTGGYKLWQGVMRNDEASWKKMERYCLQDVKLLESLYEKVKAWTPRHPNMAVYSEDGSPVCSCCGSADVEETVNRYYTNSSAYRKYMCRSCGAWSRMRKADGLVKPSSIMCDRL